MGKKKFEKNKGVTFKLVFRSEDETANPDQTLSERIFSVIEDHKKKADKSNDKERQKILSQFTKEDLGQAPIKKPKAAAVNAPPRDGASSQVKGRNDLWITHLMRMKEQAKAEADAEEDEEAEEVEKKIVKQKQQALKKATPAKKTEEEEEWEDEDDDEEWEDEDEEEEIEEEEEEEEEEQQEDVKLFKKKVVDEDEEEKPEKGKEKVLEEVQVSKKVQPVIVEEEFPELGTEGESKPNTHKEAEKTQEPTLEELAEEEIDLKKINVKGNVRMKRYDDQGLPMDGYNYYQHIVEANAGPAPSFSFTAQYDQTQLLPEDLDLRKEKMNAEEKEVYEALEKEGEAYEDLEDDFFATLTKAEAVVVEEGSTEVLKKDAKKVTFGDNEIKEILKSKDEPKKAATASSGKDPILSRKDFQKVLKQHVETLKEKYKDERVKNRAKYGMDPESSEEEEEEEPVWEVWDSDQEEEFPAGHIEKLKFKEDIAAQECVARSMSDLDSDIEDEARRTRASKDVASTKAASEYSVPVRTAKLNIVKEETNKKPKQEKSTEDKEEGSDAEEEEEDGKNKIEEVFKREKGETKEQRKERKAVVKQFKQERKEKKKKFKENFENKKKDAMSLAHRQSNNLQGLTIYKLTI